MPRSTKTPRERAHLQSKRGPIDVNCIYSVKLFIELTGLSALGFKTARKNGLIVLRVGNTRFIRGIDFDAYLRSQAGEGQSVGTENHGRTRSEVTGINPDCVYLIADLYRDAALNSNIMRQLKRNGLHTYRVGGKDFVRGDSLIESIMRSSESKRDRDERLRGKYRELFGQ